MFIASLIINSHWFFLRFKRGIRVFLLGGLLSSLILIPNGFAQSLSKRDLTKSSTFIRLTLLRATFSETTGQSSWDLGGGLPDPVVEIYHQNTLVGTSSVQSNTVHPTWNQTFPPISVKNTSFNQDSLVIRIDDYDQLDNDLICQFRIKIPNQENFNQELRIIHDDPFFILYVRWSFHDPQKNPSLSLEDHLKFQSNQRARYSDSLDFQHQQNLQARLLFDRYLKAVFNHDQLNAHHFLLQLASQFPNTRHGLKAKRILLLEHVSIP